MRIQPAFLVLLLLVSSACLLSSSWAPAGEQPVATARPATGPGSHAHQQEVMKSSYCASCHPDIYAEHTQNTHGRAFTDEEVRLATGRFSQADCIICHTPRPTFETGIGMNPIRRFHDLEEGNTCMTCHWTPGKDYSTFVGGADCKGAFDPRVGTVEACASCHRNHGTPFQWETAPAGKESDRTCVDCHMPLIERPIAVGAESRDVRSHRFNGSRSESQLRRAYKYDSQIDGNEVVVRIENVGAGHNFPTELKQRSVESVVIVRDVEGKEIARSRMVFRDPYKRPYGLTLPVNTQIPSGEAREHRVPIAVASGTVECELHFKLYYPIEDYHPDLSRRLESRRLSFTGITPSTQPVVSEPDVAVVTPEGISAETASPADLIDYARPKIGKVEVEIPGGNSEADIARLIQLFQFPVPQANGEARKKLVAIGAPAVPALIEATGSWDNKTWNQAMAVLEQIGEPAQAAVARALSDERLYVRLHACELVGRFANKPTGGDVQAALLASLKRENALDRSFAALALGELELQAAIPELRALLLDWDPDVVRAAAKALVLLEAHAAIPDIRAALPRFVYAETRRDLADALGKLGDASGIQVLIDGLDHSDDLVRESFFESFFALTGVHFCFEPLGPHAERLESLARINAWWSKEGGPEKLRHVPHLDFKTRSEVKKMVEAFGGGDGGTPAGDDEKLSARFIELGPKAVGGLTTIGLKYPPGFAVKRAKICELLGRIDSRDSVPALIHALRDPVVSVAAWACDALGRLGDADALPALQRYHQRLLSLAALGQVPPTAGHPDLLSAQAAAARFALGEAHVESDLAGLLLSADHGARTTAAQALRLLYGDDLEYDPAAPLETRRAAVERWQKLR